MKNYWLEQDPTQEEIRIEINLGSIQQNRKLKPVWSRDEPSEVSKLSVDSVRIAKSLESIGLETMSWKKLARA